MTSEKLPPKALLLTALSMSPGWYLTPCELRLFSKWHVVVSERKANNKIPDPYIPASFTRILSINLFSTGH